MLRAEPTNSDEPLFRSASKGSSEDDEWSAPRGDERSKAVSPRTMALLDEPASALGEARISADDESSAERGGRTGETSCDLGDGALVAKVSGDEEDETACRLRGRICRSGRGEAGEAVRGDERGRGGGGESERASVDADRGVEDKLALEA